MYSNTRSVISELKKKLAKDHPDTTVSVIANRPMREITFPTGLIAKHGSYKVSAPGYNTREYFLTLYKDGAYSFR
jgi:hypothetical protein